MNRKAIVVFLLCVLLLCGCGGAAKSVETQSAPAAADRGYMEEAVEMEAPAEEAKAMAAGGIANSESGGTAAGERCQHQCGGEHEGQGFFCEFHFGFSFCG